jgi:surface antigen
VVAIVGGRQAEQYRCFDRLRVGSPRRPVDDPHEFGRSPGSANTLADHTLAVHVSSTDLEVTMNKIRTALATATALAAMVAPAVVGTTAASAAAAYGPYLTVASPSLNERSAPSTGATIIGSLPYASTIYISCQTSGSLVGASVVWDQLTNGAYISDYWTNTPGFDTWTPSIPRCGTSTPPPPPTAATGRTVSYNEGGTGQCTWWAINEFHVHTGLYPNLVAPGNNGNARYWAGNAAYNGWTVTATARVGSIAVFPPFTNGAGAVGHVAWVVAVNGTSITVTEMNYAAWDRVDTRVLTPSPSVRYILAP